MKDFQYIVWLDCRSRALIYRQLRDFLTRVHNKVFHYINGKNLIDQFYDYIYAQDYYMFSIPYLLVLANVDDETILKEFVRWNVERL